MKIQNNINIIKISLKNENKDFLEKIKSISNPKWIVKRTDDATDTNKVFYLFKDLLDDVKGVCAEMIESGEVDYIENYSINPSTYEIGAYYIYGDKEEDLDNEEEQVDLTTLIFDDEEILELIDNKLNQNSTQAFDEEEDFSKEEDEFEEEHEFEKEHEDEGVEDYIEEEIYDDEEENEEEDLNFDTSSDDSLTQEEIAEKVDYFNREYVDTDFARNKANTSLTDEELIDSLMPDSKNITQELTASLDIDENVDIADYINLKRQYEISLETLYALFSDSLLSIDVDKLSKNVEKIRDELSNENLSHTKEYFDAYRQKERFTQSLEAQADAIKESYRQSVYEYARKAMAEYIKNNPDNSSEKISLLYQEASQKQQELQAKAEKAKSMAQKEILSHVLKNNKKDKALSNALSFLTIKQKFQKELNESISLMENKKRIEHKDENLLNSEAISLLRQIRDGQARPQVVTKEVIKEVPVEVIKEVVKEVPVEVIKEVPVEVIKEVPVEIKTEGILEENVNKEELFKEPERKDDTVILNNLPIKENAKEDFEEDDLDDEEDLLQDFEEDNSDAEAQNNEIDYGEAEDFNEDLYDDSLETYEEIGSDKGNSDGVSVKKGKKKLLSKNKLIGLGLGAVLLTGGIGTTAYLSKSKAKPQPPQPQTEQKNKDNENKDTKDKDASNTQNNKNTDSNKPDDSKKSTEGDIVVGTVLKITVKGNQIPATVEKIEENGDVILHDKDGNKYKVSAAKMAEFKKNQENSK